MSDDEDIEALNIEALIERSSLGTPEAKALRDAAPPEVRHAIKLASGWYERAATAEERVAVLESEIAEMTALFVAFVTEANLITTNMVEIESTEDRQQIADGLDGAVGKFYRRLGWAPP